MSLYRSFPVLIPSPSPNFNPWFFLLEKTLFLPPFKSYTKWGMYPVLMVPSALKTTSCYPLNVLTEITLLVLDTYSGNSEITVPKRFNAVVYNTTPEGLIAIRDFNLSIGFCRYEWWTHLNRKWILEPYNIGLPSYLKMVYLLVLGKE